MVAGCPKCSARYRVEPDRIGSEGAKLRCTKCSAVFLVRVPPAMTDGPRMSPDVDRARLVVIADPDEARGKLSADAVAAWGLVPHLVHDGVEAMLAIQRMLPRAVVLDAELPKMLGFQICEVVKRNESLRNTVVVLTGALRNHEPGHHDPADGYGADVYVERPDLPDGLRVILRDAGMPTGGESTESSPELGYDPCALPEDEVRDPVLSPDAASVDPPAEPSSTEASELTAERERAQRLARIAVSEMLLYQPEKFEHAVREGNLEQALDLEIQEARRLLRERVSERVRAETDHVLDELNRVAAERIGLR